MIEISALRALALAADGEDTAAVDSLAGALTLGYPQGYVRVFADEGAPMAVLLGRLAAAQKADHAVARGIPPGYLAALLRAARPPPAPRHPAPEAARRRAAWPARAADRP